jgi:hypothetical protein
MARSLGDFAKLREATINSPAFIRQIFMKFNISVFTKICRDYSSLIKIWQEWRVLYVKTSTHLWYYLYQFFLEWEMFHTKLLKNSNICFFKKFFFSKVVPFVWKCEKYFRAGQATDDTMAQAHCMLDIKGYKHKHTHTHTNTQTHTHTEYVIRIAFPRQ